MKLDIEFATDQLCQLARTNGFSRGQMGLKKYQDDAVAPVEGVVELSIDGAPPTEEAIGNGSFPLWSFEHVYTNGPPSREASRFLAVAQTNVDAIHALGFIPIRALTSPEKH